MFGALLATLKLRKEALACKRANLLNPKEKPQVPHISQLFKNESGVVVAVSDFMKAVPDMVSKWVPLAMNVLGTDGFGRSETRARLRRYFEIDDQHIAWAALVELYNHKKNNQQSAR